MKLTINAGGAEQIKASTFAQFIMIYGPLSIKNTLHNVSIKTTMISIGSRVARSYSKPLNQNSAFEADRINISRGTVFSINVKFAAEASPAR